MRELTRPGEGPAAGVTPDVSPQAVALPRSNVASSVWAGAHVRWLALIVLAALIVRVAWVANVQPDPRDGRFDDSVWYYRTGHLLANGEGYVFPFGTECEPDEGLDCPLSDNQPATALWAPGYPVLLAGAFSLPGDDVAWGRVLNVTAGLVLVCAVYYLGARLWSTTAGLLAAAIVAFFPSHIFFSSLLLTETVFTAMLTCVLCLTLAWTMERDVPPWKLVTLGLAVGGLALVRPEASMVLVVIGAAWFALDRSWRWLVPRTGLLVLGVALLLLPWTVRNWIEIGSPVVTTTGFGQVLLQAHHPLADGQPDIGIVVLLWDEFEHVPFPEREVKMNAHGVREAIAYAVQHPGRDLSLAPERFAAFYRSDRGAIVWNQVPDGAGARVLSSQAADSWGLFADIYYYAVIAYAVVGLPFWLRRARAGHVLILAPFVLYSLLWAFVFVGEPRYHFALGPVFAVMAGTGVAALFERLAGRPPEQSH
jgi:4-amino-4-deoxy-L-arabinose transferase-like glycosyltransferase